MDCYAVRRRSLRSSEQVVGASYTRWTSVQHIDVDHGGFHIAVAEQFLNRADVGALIQQVRSERMAEGVARCWLADSRRLHRCRHSTLQKAGIEMEASLPVLPWMPPTTALGKQPLSSPFPRSILVHTPHALHVPFQGHHQAGNQHCVSVLVFLYAFRGRDASPPAHPLSLITKRAETQHPLTADSGIRQQ